MPRNLASSAGVIWAVGLLLGGLSGCAVQPDPGPSSATPPRLSTPSPAATFLPVHDLGRMRFATGEASALAPHRYRYRVAAGDTLTGISQRFGACVPSLADQSTGGLEVFEGAVLVISRAGLAADLDICAPG